MARNLRLRRAMLKENICAWCGDEVREKHGVFWWMFGFIVDQGACDAAVTLLHKNRTRTEKGKFRSRAEVWHLLDAHREKTWEEKITIG